MLIVSDAYSDQWSIHMHTQTVNDLVLIWSILQQRLMFEVGVVGGEIESQLFEVDIANET